MGETEHAEIRDADRIHELLQETGKAVYTKDPVIDLIRSEGRNSAWLYFVVIRPEHRNKGYASRLMNRFFAEARRFGFEQVGLLPNWYEDRDQIIVFRKL